MFKWTAMCANESGYHGLHDELRRGSGCYILDGVEMPASCGGRICTIEFRYYGEEHIEIICADAPVEYSGSYRSVSEWLKTGKKIFTSFGQLTDFLRLFNENRPQMYCEPIAEFEHSKQSAAPADAEMSYDKERIKIPEAKKPYIAIDSKKMTEDLKSEIFGQDEQLEKLVHITRNFLGTKEKKRPVSVFLYGAPGTGKTEVTAKIAEMINRQTEADNRYGYRLVDCTQFQERADISRLTGAAPGYVGFDEPGVFAVLEDNPNTIFVFDDIDKAAPNITEAIMLAMESGRQATNGKTLRNGESFYDLSHCIIFFTSNIEIRDKKRLGFTAFAPPPEKKETLPLTETDIARAISNETRDAKNAFLETGAFRREVISRMTAIIRFNDLAGDVITDISAKCIKNVAAAHHLVITRLETSVLQDFINATAGEVERFGVRELRREAENYFTNAFLEYAFTHDDYAKITVSGELADIIITPA